MERPCGYHATLQEVPWQKNPRRLQPRGFSLVTSLGTPLTTTAPRLFHTLSHCPGKQFPQINCLQKSWSIILDETYIERSVTAGRYLQLFLLLFRSCLIQLDRFWRKCKNIPHNSQKIPKKCDDLKRSISMYVLFLKIKKHYIHKKIVVVSSRIDFLRLEYYRENGNWIKWRMNSEYTQTHYTVSSFIKISTFLGVELLYESLCL